MLTITCEWLAQLRERIRHALPMPNGGTIAGHGFFVKPEWLEPPPLDFDEIRHLPISARRQIVEQTCGFGPFPKNDMALTFLTCEKCGERLRHAMPMCWACGTLDTITPRQDVFQHYLLSVILLTALVTMMTLIATNHLYLTL